MRHLATITTGAIAVGLSTAALVAPANAVGPDAGFQQQTAMKAIPGGTAIAPPGTAYGKISRAKRSLLGFSGLTVTYSFYQAPNTQARFCPAVRGYVKSGSGYKAKWYKGPCGRSMKVKVPWGKAASYPAVKIRSAETITGAVAKWSY